MKAARKFSGKGVLMSGMHLINSVRFIVGCVLLILLTGCTVPVPLDSQFATAEQSFVEVPIVELLWINPPPPEKLSHTIKYWKEDGTQYVQVDFAWEEKYALLPYETYMVEIIIVPEDDQEELAGFVAFTPTPSKTLVIRDLEEATILWHVTRRHTRLITEWHFSQVETVVIFVGNRIL